MKPATFSETLRIRCGRPLKQALAQLAREQAVAPSVVQRDALRQYILAHLADLPLRLRRPFERERNRLNP